MARLYFIDSAQCQASSKNPTKLDVSVVFYPRSWDGCLGLGWCVGALAISIHAPVWGATPTGSYTGTQSLFQFTRPCGARLAYK